MKERFHAIIRWVQHYSDRPWYPLFIAVLAGIDNWIFVVPTDGLVISGVMLAPKRWLQFATIVPLLSTIGGITFAAFVAYEGLPYLQSHWPELLQSAYWKWTETFFYEYGLLIVFLIATSPFTQQPALIIAAFAHTPYSHLFVTVLAGRLIKYLFLAWVAAKAPAVLSRLWGIKGELKEVKEDLPSS